MNKRELGNLTVNITFHFLLIILIAISGMWIRGLKEKQLEKAY